MNQVTQRSIEDFVDDAISDGRTLKQVKAVATATHWESSIEKIIMAYNDKKQFLKNLSKKRRI